MVKDLRVSCVFIVTDSKDEEFQALNVESSTNRPCSSKSCES